MLIHVLAQISLLEGMPGNGGFCFKEVEKPGTSKIDH
jgi:hypothetical protein